MIYANVNDAWGWYDDELELVTPQPPLPPPAPEGHNIGWVFQDGKWTDETVWEPCGSP